MLTPKANYIQEFAAYPIFANFLRSHRRETFISRYIVMNTIFLVFSVRNTVAFSIATIAQWDWPDHWPQLFDILMQVSLLCRLCLCLSLYGSLCVGLSLFLCYDAPRTSSLYKVRFVSTRSSLSLYFFSFPLSISIFLISFNSLRTRL